MTNHIIDEIKAGIAKLEAELAPAAETAEADAKAIGSAAFNYIKTNGLQDLYQIAMTIVGAAVSGTPWGTTLASITAQAVTDGKQIEQGAVAVVAAQAQADLIAAGSLLPPAAAAPKSA